MPIKKILDVTDDLALVFNSSNGHLYLRALRSFPVDSILHSFSAREYVQHPTYLSVQVGECEHIHLSPEFLQYINHSCEPNTFFDVNKKVVIALRDISENEDITFFYPSTEWSMVRPFECFCSTPSCLGTIQGAFFLDRNSANKYRFADHIRKKLDQHWPELIKPSNSSPLPQSALHNA